jgi:hypothetical protein
MLKTAKKMFTITFFTPRGDGMVNSKFEAQIITVKLRTTDGKDNSACKPERRSG